MERGVSKEDSLSSLFSHSSTVQAVRNPAVGMMISAVGVDASSQIRLDWNSNPSSPSPTHNNSKKKNTHPSSSPQKKASTTPFGPLFPPLFGLRSASSSPPKKPTFKIGMSRNRFEQSVKKKNPSIGQRIGMSLDKFKNLFSHRNISKFEDSAKKSLKTFGRSAARAAALSVERGTNGLLKPWQKDRKYEQTYIGQDSHGRMKAYSAKRYNIDSVSPIRPQKGYDRHGKEILFVNGINTPAADAYKQGQALANKTGSPVVNVHVATGAIGKHKLDGILPDGTLFGDGVRALANHAGLQTDPAAKSLQKAIEQKMGRGEKVNIFAHSMGGIVTSEAIRDEKKAMRKRGLSEREINQRMHSGINIETIGTAAKENPSGPNWFRNVVSDGDPVAGLLGLGSKGAKANGPVIRIPGTTDPKHKFDRPLYNHLWDHYYPSISPFPNN